MDSHIAFSFRRCFYIITAVAMATAVSLPTCTAVAAVDAERQADNGTVDENQPNGPIQLPVFPAHTVITLSSVLHTQPSLSSLGLSANQSPVWDAEPGMSMTQAERDQEEAIDLAQLDRFLKYLEEKSTYAIQQPRAPYDSELYPVMEQFADDGRDTDEEATEAEDDAELKLMESALRPSSSVTRAKRHQTVAAAEPSTSLVRQEAPPPSSSMTAEHMMTLPEDHGPRGAPVAMRRSRRDLIETNDVPRDGATVVAAKSNVTESEHHPPEVAGHDDEEERNELERRLQRLVIDRLRHSNDLDVSILLQGQYRPDDDSFTQLADLPPVDRENPEINDFDLGRFDKLQEMATINEVPEPSAEGEELMEMTRMDQDEHAGVASDAFRPEILVPVDVPLKRSSTRRFATGNRRPAISTGRLRPAAFSADEVSVAADRWSTLVREEVKKALDEYDLVYRLADALKKDNIRLEK
jgi:hypothetical protein